jgi:RHS repeat-associated protein
VVVETDAGGALVASYVRAGDQLLAELKGDGSVRCYHEDGLGSVRVLTGTDGTMTDGYGYTAFGEALGWTGMDAQPYRFAGEEWKTGESYYLRARWYTAGIGLFAGIDEVVRKIENSSTAYSYGANNPALMTDPAGLWAGAIHNEINRIAIGGLVRNNEMEIINAAGEEMDLQIFPGLLAWASRAVRQTSLDAANQHALTKPGQSVDDARRIHALFVDDNTRHAIDTWHNRGPGDPGVMHALGRAFHALADASSPAHAFREWGSNPAQHAPFLGNEWFTTPLCYEAADEIASRYQDFLQATQGKGGLYRREPFWGATRAQQIGYDRLWVEMTVDLVLAFSLIFF